MALPRIGIRGAILWVMLACVFATVGFAEERVWNQTLTMDGVTVKRTFRVYVLDHPKAFYKLLDFLSDEKGSLVYVPEFTDKANVTSALARVASKDKDTFPLLFARSLPSIEDYELAIKELDAIIEKTPEKAIDRVGQAMTEVFRDWLLVILENEREVVESLETALAETDRRFKKKHYRGAVEAACVALQYRRRTGEIQKKIDAIRQAFYKDGGQPAASVESLLKRAKRTKDFKARLTILAQALLFEKNEDILRQLDAAFDAHLKKPQMKEVRDSLAAKQEKKKFVRYVSVAGTSQNAVAGAQTLCNVIRFQHSCRWTEFGEDFFEQCDLMQREASEKLVQARKRDAEADWKKTKELFLEWQKVQKEWLEIKRNSQCAAKYTEEIEAGLKECEENLQRIKRESEPDASGAERNGQRPSPK